MSDDPGWKPQALDEPKHITTWGLVKAVLTALAAWFRGRSAEERRAATRIRVEALAREGEQDEALTEKLEAIDNLSGPELDAELNRVLRVQGRAPED